jgi:GT2 family glycosyltransferase
LEIINFKKDDEISVLLEQQSALQLENDQQKSIINKLKEIEEEYQQAEQQTLNYLAHINQLLQKERDLNNILKSGGWKFLCKYYWLRDKLLPDNSKRRLLAKLTVKTLKNPKLMFKSFNKQNVKKLKYYLKTDNIKLVESRINNYVERYEEPPSREIKIIEKSDLKEKITFPYFESPLVSIIIPVYNQWDYTYACLVSILSQTEYIPYEVIVADDLSKDETVNIKECVSNITVIRDGQNRGFLLNCNNAAKFARGKYIFFLNNDTNVQENWLQSLLELIESNSSIGMVGSKLVYPDGRLQEAGGIIWNDASGWNYGRLDDPENPKYNYVKEVDYISGTAIMIRSDLWLKIGGFDTRYVPAYFEDSDLAFEVRKHGYRVVYQPKSVIVHFEGISHGTDINKGMKAYQVLNKEKFVEKWSEVLKSENFENAKHVFLARDRSRLKKTILVIDHYVPQYDKDAGSRTAYQYLKLFVEMGFNVKFIGDNFYKHEPYASELEQLGIEILYGSWYSKHYKDWLELNGAYIDYVYLNRPHISIKYIDIVRKSTKAKIFYYGHDLHFMRELREYELTKNDALLKSAEEWKAIEVELFQKSDVIYYPSQVEVTEIHKLNPSWNAKAIPAYIYEADTPQYKEEDFKYRKDLLFVGGFGHRPNIDAVRWFKNEIFPILNRRFPELRIHIVGSNPPQEIKDYHSPQVNITGFVSDDELISYYRSARVVVVPLRYGAGVKGKVVEALYHHLPIVTTSIGSEGLPDIDGYLIEANDTPTFAKALIDIYEDYAKLEALSNNSSEYIRSYFSKKAVLQVLEQDFQ